MCARAAPPLVASACVEHCLCARAGKDLPIWLEYGSAARAGNIVYVAGGATPPATPTATLPFATVHKYDVTTDSWATNSAPLCGACAPCCRVPTGQDSQL